MSAPPRSPRGGGSPRGSRAGTPTALRSHGRASSRSRGGIGRGGSAETRNMRAEGLFQGLQAGNVNQRARASDNGRGEKDPSNPCLRSVYASLSCAAASPIDARLSSHEPSANMLQHEGHPRAERARSLVGAHTRVRHHHHNHSQKLYPHRISGTT
jgi:hypothetical protein